MPLTDTVVRQAKPGRRDLTLKDTDGLALFVSVTGAKSWHFRFSWSDKQPRISLGTYPEISLKDARELRDQARALVAKGIDPRVHRRQERKAALVVGENTFEAVFERWRGFKALSLRTGRQSTLSQIDRIFKKDVLPWLGQRSVFEIARTDLVEVLRKIERRHAYTTAEKCRTWFNQMFRYALVEFGLDTNPAADLDIVAMPQPPVRHNPFLRMNDLPAFLKKLGCYDGDVNTQLGLRLLLLTGVRTGELRSAVPEQFDLDQELWIIPPVVVKQLQLKLRKESADIPPYIVPLSSQAIAIVRYLLAAMTPAQRYLLPHRSEPKERISENTLNAALKRMGYQGQLTGHGIRATISTALNELGYRQEWVEAQLSHADPNQIRAAYNHAEYVEQRRQMMQEWADRLDQCELTGMQGAGEVKIPLANGCGARAPEPPVVGSIGAAPMAVPAATAEAHIEPDVVVPLMTILARRDQRPQPILTGIQCERAVMVATFEAPQNLPLPVFAKLAGKSRDQINRDIKHRRLLSLTLGNRGHRIPDWQLDPVRHAFTCAVLERVPERDAWAIYGAMSEPLDGLSGRTPIDAVSAGNVDEVMDAVCRALSAGLAPGDSGAVRAGPEPSRLQPPRRDELRGLTPSHRPASDTDCLPVVR
ncbi:MAG: DUF4102 domain-containing protein [Betaproteobacteria bacterium]|nr:DUF4102 domain-containing protein [Betaproteobacteria bacterium]